MIGRWLLIVTALFAPIVMALFAPSLGWAQGFNLARGNNEEIQVYADEGVEWAADATRVIARGNAKAIRGGVTVTADTLTAYYRDGVGGNEIWRLDADGHVTIQTKTETATGRKASYDLEKAIFVLRGDPAKVVTPTDEVTANDTLEYWEKERMAVARGDALAISKGRKIRSDVLTAHFRDGPKGELELRRADGFGHVVLTTPKETVTGDRSDYNLETGIATVAGSVKIIRDGNELNGGYAHVNLNTGISKLFGAAPGTAGDTRVRGTFMPEKQDPTQRRAVFKGAGSSAEQR